MLFVSMCNKDLRTMDVEPQYGNNRAYYLPGHILELYCVRCSQPLLLKTNGKRPFYCLLGQNLAPIAIICLATRN